MDQTPTFESEKYVWLRRKLPVDLLAMDDEITEMPELIRQAGECVSMSIELRETSKEELDRVQAMAAARLRGQEKAPGKGPPSESAIETMVPLDPDYQKALEQLSTARLDAGLWMSLMEAMRAKNSNIRVAADLINSGFLTTDFIREKRRKEIRQVKA